jgi:hypothetical protein
MIDSMRVLDVLRERGYMPLDDADLGEGWFDYPAGRHTVRAVLRDDGEGGEVVTLTEHGTTEWAVEVRGAPGAVFLAILDAAEREAGIVRDDGPAGECESAPERAL